MMATAGVLVYRGASKPVSFESHHNDAEQWCSNLVGQWLRRLR